MPHNALYFSHEEIQAVCELAVLQREVALGDRLCSQQRGVPIGGPLSKQLASVFLGYDEIMFEQNHGALQSLGLDIRGMSRKDIYCFSRYVDDVAGASGLLCFECLKRMISVIYSKPVRFEENPEQPIVTAWLDFWISTRTGRISFEMSHAEEQYVLSGGSELPGKIRIPPYLGKQFLDPNLRSMVGNKLIGMKQVGLDEAELRQAVCREIQLWVLAGYPRSILQQLFYNPQANHEATMISVNIFKGWREELPHLQRIQPANLCMIMSGAICQARILRSYLAYTGCIPSNKAL